MIKIKTRAVSNPRTSDGKWENMTGCHCCGEISSAYLAIDIYQNSSRIAKNIKLCKGCLNKGENLIDEKILQFSKVP
jgi:hypothetical protein